MSTPTSPADGHPRGARSRDGIIAAAERLMSAHGYSATSMSTLVRASGLPASSIYWHFGSKSGVLDAVLERGAGRLFTAAAGPTRPDPQEPPERLRTMVGCCLASIGEHRQFLRLYFALLLGAASPESVRHETMPRLRAHVRGLLTDGLVWVYLPWGEQAALHVAERLTGITETLFDGIFFAIEAGEADENALVEQAVSALHAIAESTLRTPLRTPQTRTEDAAPDRP